MSKRQSANLEWTQLTKRSRISSLPSLHHTPYCKDIPTTTIQCPPGPKRDNTYPPFDQLKQSLSDTTSQWGIQFTDNAWIIGHSKGGQWRDYLQVVVNNKLWFHMDNTTTLNIIPKPRGMTLTLQPQGIWNINKKQVTLNVTTNFYNMVFLAWVFRRITALRQRMNNKMIFQYLGQSNVSIKCEHQEMTITKPLPVKIEWKMPWVPSVCGTLVANVYHMTETQLVYELGSVFPTSVRKHQSNILEDTATEGANGKEWDLRKPMWLRGGLVDFISRNENLDQSIQPDIFTDPALPLQQRWKVWENTRTRPKSCLTLALRDKISF